MKRIYVFEDLLKCGYPVVAIKYLFNPNSKLFKVYTYQFIDLKEIKAYEIPFEYCFAIFIHLYYLSDGYNDVLKTIWNCWKDSFEINNKSKMLIDRFIFDCFNISYDHVITGVKTLHYQTIFDSIVNIDLKY